MKIDSSMIFLKSDKNTAVYMGWVQYAVQEHWQQHDKEGSLRTVPIPNTNSSYT